MLEVQMRIYAGWSSTIYSLLEDWASWNMESGSKWCAQAAKDKATCLKAEPSKFTAFPIFYWSM